MTYVWLLEPDGLHDDWYLFYKTYINSDLPDLPETYINSDLLCE